MRAGWEAGPARAAASPAEVHVWRADLGSRPRPPLSSLPAEERERAASLRPHVRERWVAARWALRDTLARYLDRDPARIELRLGARGKPGLAVSPSPLRFNLSHTGDLLLVAVTGEREVGIDVEETDPGRDVARLAEVGLDRGDAAAIRTAPAGARAGLFYAAWVRREAVAKCLGVGLGAPLPDSPVSVSELDAGHGRAAAVAVAAPAPLPLRRFSLPPL